MELTALVLLIGFFILIIFGIFFLIKYFKTKQKIYLWLGLFLIFIIPGIIFGIIFLIYWYYSSTTMMCYAPVESTPTIKIIGLIITPLFIKQRHMFINKFEKRVSKDVFKKITQKKKQP